MHNLCIYPELLIQHGSTHSALSDRLSFYLIFKTAACFYMSYFYASLSAFLHYLGCSDLPLSFTPLSRVCPAEVISFSVYKYSSITRLNKIRAFISIFLPLPFLSHKGQTREILFFHPRRFHLSLLSFISRSASTLQCQLISGGLGQPCRIGTREPSTTIFYNITI